MNRTSTDELFMKQTFRLAKKGIGKVAPNPLVGSVIVKSGQVIATGWHDSYSKPHAEAVALHNAGENARGSDLFVNLEPCCHWGKTPPCTDAIIRAGIKRVIFSNEDSNPKVRQCDSQQALMQAGIEVVSGILAQQGRLLNEVFFKYMETGLPFVALKMGLTLDARIADRYGESKWITSEASRRDVGRIRSRYDAIMVGIGTVLKDNPSLGIRRGTHTLTKIIMDPDLQLPLNAKLFEDGSKVLVVSEKRHHGSTRHNEHLARGVLFIFLEAGTTGFNLVPALQAIAQRSMTSILVEGGGKLAHSLISQRLVDKLYWYIAPKLFADNQSKPVLDGEMDRCIGDLEKFSLNHVRRIGDDVRLVYYPTLPQNG
ncbi:MAG: bifunctional diaminohydroxyphosphoribosylaminopyrimidine deaminase/5-amino-6-(5-phosphoribosylamino)uracil reductase RibD [Candidatus Margulisiibacteriota bacterium]